MQVVSCSPLLARAAFCNLICTPRGACLCVLGEQFRPAANLRQEDCAFDHSFCVVQFFSKKKRLYFQHSARASRTAALFILVLHWRISLGVCRTRRIFRARSTSKRNEIQIYFPATLVKRLFCSLKSHTLARLHVDALDFFCSSNLSRFAKNEEPEN